LDAFDQVEDHKLLVLSFYLMEYLWKNASYCQNDELLYENGRIEN
jgi:hypothetical protein